MKVIKYCDLCCGIGGFRIGIQEYQENHDNIKFECVLSADIKKQAIDTYNVNFGNNIVKMNIYDIIPNEINSFDLLCAGFPCQPFSSAGNKKGFEDERGGMIFKIIEICKYHKPSVIILENVSNLLTIDKGACISKIVHMFEEIGYSVSYKKLNSQNFGCAQSRERVYILCKLGSRIYIEDKVCEKKYLHEIIQYTDTVSDLDDTFTNKLLNMHHNKSIHGCKIGDKRGGNNNIHSWDIEYNGVVSDEEKYLMNKLMLERRKKKWAIKKEIQWMDGMPLTKDEIKTFYNHEKLQEMLDNLVDLKYLKMEKCKDLVNGKRVYKEESEIGYNICKGKLSYPLSKILDPYDVSPTLTATDSNKLGVVVGNCVRRLNKTELKLICGFPGEFIIPDHVNAFDLFGNMATPPVITHLLCLIYDNPID